MPTSNHLRTKPADFSQTIGTRRNFSGVDVGIGIGYRVMSLQRAWSQPSAAYLEPQIEAAAAATRCSFAC